MNRRILILLVIVLVTFFLRTYKIETNPPGLSWDEVSIGYNAYSILKTGRDEHGKAYPIDAFAAYGDYKPPVSIYFTVPFVAFFGLRELSVRLPSAIFGTATVFLSYFLVRELFTAKHSSNPLKSYQVQKNQRNKSEEQSTIVALISTSLLAISPWHINISRAGFEANIALFFVLLGITLILHARHKPKIWTYAWLPFVVSVYTFNSSRYFVILFSFFLIIYFYLNIRSQIRLFTIGVLMAALALLPIVPHLLSKEARLRFAEVNIFTDSAIVKSSNARMGREGNNLVSRVIHNRRIGYAKSFIDHFLDTFQPDFLFIKGDRNPKFSTQDIGQLFLIDAPLLLLGLVLLTRTDMRLSLFLLCWLIFSIIPAATARETPHALRLLNSLPVWQIYIAYGITNLVKKIRNISSNKRINIPYAGILIRQAPVFIGVGIICFYFFQFTYYLYNYYVHYPRIYAAEWQYGYKQAFEYIQQVGDKYDSVYISDRIGRPYMYGLFYLQYDPIQFSQEKVSYFDASGFYHVEQYGKYIFIKSRPHNLPPKSLIVGDAYWAEENNTILKKIEYPNGETAILIYQ